jgi:hypothetical protein
MKMVKSLLLGTAAGLVAMSGAQAADLPVKAKPVQYVKICSLYGAGFYYIPGTDTCLKIGGFVRTELNFNAGGSFNPYHVQNLDAPQKNFTLWRSRAVITADARSQTEYGTLRSYFAFGVNWDNGIGSGASSLNAYRGFIQWAGFTAGRAQSFFDFYNTPAYSNTTNVWGSDTGGTGQNVLGYTAQFGNGFSATLAIEDGAHRRVCGGGGATSCVTGILPAGYAGVTWPDFVANLRIDQSWGSAQIMGALHYVEAFGPAGLATTDEIGWAVGAGLTLNLPMIGARDTLSAQVTYAEGALHYVGSGIGNAGGLGGFAIFTGFPTITGAAIGPGLDAVVLPGLNLTLTTGWSVVAGYQHYWNPKWRTSIYGAYGDISYDQAVVTATAGVINDWSMWQIGSRTVWTPVTNLDLSVDIMYNNVDGIPIAGVDTNIGWLQGMVRAQRNFYP